MKPKGMFLLLALALLLTACARTAPAEADSPETPEAAVETAAPDEAAETTIPDDPSQDIIDRAADIRAEAENLQDELTQIDALAAQYDEAILSGASQVEMNNLAQWPLLVWELELQSLRDRMGSVSETEQQIWMARRDAVISEILQEYEQGSIYPLLYADLQTSLTRNRTYQTAWMLAAANGEDFTMPERGKPGVYLDGDDNQIDSKLILTEATEDGGTDAAISIDGVGTTTGSVTESGGKLLFEDAETGLQAEIACTWDQASFTVTNPGSSAFQTGDVFTFSIVL